MLWVLSVSLFTLSNWIRYNWRIKEIPPKLTFPNYRRLHSTLLWHQTRKNHPSLTNSYLLKFCKKSHDKMLPGNHKKCWCRWGDDPRLCTAVADSDQFQSRPRDFPSLHLSSDFWTPCLFRFPKFSPSQDMIFFFLFFCFRLRSNKPNSLKLHENQIVLFHSVVPDLFVITHVVKDNLSA